MRNLPFIFALLMAYSFGYSQVTFTKGYMVNLKGDTLQGELKINPKKPFDTFTKVFFKDNNGVQKTYKPDKVKAYGFDGKNFIVSKYGDELMFFKILVSGELMLYEIMYEEMNMGTISYKSEYYVAKKGEEEFTRVKPGKFKKQFTELTKDNPDIMAGVGDDEKKAEIEKITEVVKQYNNWAKTK